ARYAALLVDYREMKIAFHDQLSDELKFAGCDLDRLLARAAATGAVARRDEAWPATVAAPGSESLPPDEPGPGAPDPAVDPAVTTALPAAPSPKPPVKPATDGTQATA